MARTAEKVEDLLDEDAGMGHAIEVVLERSEDGPLNWSDVSDELTTGQWSRLQQKGVVVDADGAGFTVDDPDAVREALNGRGSVGSVSRSTSSSSSSGGGDSSWSKWDKLAALGAVGLFAGYSIAQVRNTIGQAIDVFLGPLDAALPFYAVVLVLALFTGLYSTLLQANLMDMDKMSEYQQQMQAIQEKRKEAKERGDDEELERIQEEQMEAMGDQLGMFKEQFRPMVWIMLLTIPVFLWMYWMILSDQALTPQTIVMPLAGEVTWRKGIVGPIQVWIVWYFLCSMGFTQIIRKALNIQTTPT